MITVELLCRGLQEAASKESNGRAAATHMHALAVLIAATPYSRLEPSLLPTLLHVRIGTSLPLPDLPSILPVWLLQMLSNLACPQTPS